IVEKEVIEPSLDLKELMDLDDGTRLVKIVRIRYGNEQPFIIERSYFVHHLFQPLMDMDLEANSIFELLYKHTDTRLGEARQQITAISAGPKEVELLKTEKNAPLLLMKRLIKTQKGNIFQYSEDV